MLCCAAVLLLKASERWLSEHEGAPPSTAKQRAEFKELVSGMRRTVEGVPIEVGRTVDGAAWWGSAEENYPVHRTYTLLYYYT